MERERERCASDWIGGSAEEALRHNERVRENERARMQFTH